MVSCSSCGCTEPRSFSKTQFKKGPRARCRTCVEKDAQPMAGTVVKAATDNPKITRNNEDNESNSDTRQPPTPLEKGVKQTVPTGDSGAQDKHTHSREKQNRHNAPAKEDETTKPAPAAAAAAAAAKGNGNKDETTHGMNKDTFMKEAPQQPNKKEKKEDDKEKEDRNKETNDDYDNDNDDDEENEFDDNESDHDKGGISVEALKRQILGRSINTGYEEEDNHQDATVSCKDDLEKELQCAICHDLLLEPVSLLCGHCYCKACLEWWRVKTPKCPTCRQPIHTPKKNGQEGEAPSLAVNRALQACVEFLFGTQLEARKAQQKKAMSGENQGRHNRGYEVVQHFGDKPYQTIHEKVRARQCIVLDAEHRQMRLAVGVESLSWPENKNDDDDDPHLNISVCILVLEEDEMEEGTPILLKDEGDEHLISNTPRFVGTHLQLFWKTNNRKKAVGEPKPLESGVPMLSFELKAYGTYLVEHSESGAMLELHLSREGFAMAADSSENEGDEDALDEDEQQQHDDFLVNDDVCHICKDGGELMICDGGDEHGGCGRSFHIGCVHLSKVPEGDWICQECATKDGFESVGIEGHEFKEDEEEVERNDDSSMSEGRMSPPLQPAYFRDENSEDESDGGNQARFSPEQEPLEEEDDNDDEEDESPVIVRKPRKRQRVQVLDDSDSE